MFAPYAAALRTPGALAFSAAGFVGRLPISMTSLGIVLLVSARTGSYGLAGAVSAVFLVAAAVCSPLQARVADRRGQAAVLWPLLVGQVLGYGSFVVAAAARPGAVELGAAAALIGATQPQVGSMVRARWSTVTAGTPLVHTAYALESVLDEAIFVAGPVIVTVLAASVSPYAGVLVTLGLAVVGGAALAVQRLTEPQVHELASGPRPKLPVGELATLALAFVALGGVFGALDVTVVAVADEAGARGLAGFVLACFASGSLVAGIVFGALRWRAGLRTRLLVTHAALASVLLALPFLRSLGALAVGALVVGLAISPTIVTGFTFVQHVVPGARLTEGLAWLTTGIGAGLAAGGAIAGQVVDAAGATTALWVPTVAGVLAVVPVAVARWRRAALPDQVAAEAGAVREA